MNPTPSRIADGSPAPSTNGTNGTNGTQSFHDVLRSLIGKTVTVVTSESYEDAPVGHQIRAGFHRAKMVGVGEDLIVLRTERKRHGRGEAEPVKQVIPLSSLKRISLMKSELVLHL